jgi:hypothetical protein
MDLRLLLILVFSTTCANLKKDVKVMECKPSINYDWSRETYLLLKLISNRQCHFIQFPIY